MKNNIVTVMFSKNRPLQCDLALSSLNYCCGDIEYSDVFVLYKCDPEYVEAYEILIQEHPGVIFIRETYFDQNMFDIFYPRDYKYVMFVVDDTIFVDHFAINTITDLLDIRPLSLGFSLRLGENCKYCYPLDMVQDIPPMTSILTNIMEYNWTKAEHDFAYPLEISSSIYRTEDIKPILSGSSTIYNPNHLESVMDYYSRYYKPVKPMLLCPGVSMAFANPINKVQDVNNNRAGEMQTHSPKSLLHLYNYGLRIHPKKFFRHIPSACHEVVLLFKESDYYDS